MDFGAVNAVPPRPCLFIWRFDSLLLFSVRSGKFNRLNYSSGPRRNEGSGPMKGPGRSREMYHSLLVASPHKNVGRRVRRGQSGVRRRNPGADSRVLGVNSVSEITALTRRRVAAYLHQAEALATNFGKRKGRRKGSRSEHSPRTSPRLRCSEKAGAGFRQEPTPAFDERGSYRIVGNKCLLLEVTAKT
jgi:hypothetical protein